MRKTANRPWLLVLAAFSITLMRLPQYFGHNRPIKIVALVLFTVGIMVLVPVRHRRLSGRTMGLVLLYAAIVGVEILRGAQIHAYSDLNSAAIEAATYIAVLLFAAMLVVTAGSRSERQRRLIALVFAPAIYVAANALMHLGGDISPATLNPNRISVAANTPATLLGKLGIHALRVEFPLTNSVNGFGIVAGAVLASTVVLAGRTKNMLVRVSCLGFALASLYCLLWGDNRGALVIAIVIIALFTVSTRLRISRAVAVLLPMFPLLVVVGLGLIGGSSLVGTFSREGHNLATATNRLFIWEAAWNVLKHPSINWLYGWGAGGQITSGATAAYAHLFGTLSAATVESTHNVVIQALFDGGLIALLALAAACYVAIDSLSRMADEPACAALLASLLVVILSGLTEDTPSYYTQEALLIVLLAFGAAAALAVLPRNAPSMRRRHSRGKPTPAVPFARRAATQDDRRKALAGVG